MSLCLKVIYGTFANKSGFVIYITPGPAQRSSKSKDDNPLILLGRKFKRRIRATHLVLQIRSKTPTLVVFRVKKRETGKVNTTTKNESSSRTRDRPGVNNLTWVSYLKKDEHFLYLPPRALAQEVFLPLFEIFEITCSAKRLKPSGSLLVVSSRYLDLSHGLILLTA